MAPCHFRRGFTLPPATEVQSVQDHLCYGVTLDAVQDFLSFVEWPHGYQRSFQDETQNGVLRSKCGRKQVMGYDLVAFIRDWLERNDYSEFSVAEVMMAAGHPGVKQADLFLSHCQCELVSTTLNAMSRASSFCGDTAFFLDYFILRQCQPGDFDPIQVKDAIRRIGHTVVVLDPHIHPWPVPVSPSTYKPEAIARVWCAYEMYCSLATETMLSGVFTFDGIKCLDPEASDVISLEDCQSRNPQDKIKLLQQIRSDNIWSMDDINTYLEQAVRRASAAAAFKLVILRVMAPCSAVALFYVFTYAFMWKCQKSTGCTDWFRELPSKVEISGFGNLADFFSDVIADVFFRQFLLVSILGVALAELKITGRDVRVVCTAYGSQLKQFFCRCWRRILLIVVLTFPVWLIVLVAVAYLALFSFFGIVLPFGMFRLVRCCFRCCCPLRKIHVNSWYAYQSDFFSIVAVLLFIDWMIFFEPVMTELSDYSTPFQFVSWILSVPTFLFVAVLWARISQPQEVLAQNPPIALLPANHAGGFV